MYTEAPQLAIIEDSGKFLLDRVAFFGRTLAEYSQMFGFEPESYRGKRILDCAAGPASFAAEANLLGVYVTACDPLYDLTAEELVPRATHDIALCLINKDANIDLFDHKLLDECTQFAAEKERAVWNFRNDYARGRVEGRYVTGRLPELPFPDDHFHMALCSNLLFLYASRENGGMLKDDGLSVEFHLKAIVDLLRVVREEVRIYPVKGPNRPDSPMADAVTVALTDAGIRWEYEDVDFKDVGAANKLLRIFKDLN